MPTPTFPANAHRHDPYRTFKYVRKLPGTSKDEDITLEQGSTYDPVFENWADLVNNIQSIKLEIEDWQRDTSVSAPRES